MTLFTQQFKGFVGNVDEAEDDDSFIRTKMMRWHSHGRKY